MIRRISFFPLLAVFMLVFFILPAGAIYDFEGIPLKIVAQGEVPGEVQTFGTYGLDSPPYQLTFTLPVAPQYARVYTGIWGGTEKYSGWAELNINNLKKVRYSLYGERDRNREVYTSGHGIYWIAYDATDLLRKGSNTVVVNTSKNEEGNRLDGRVYCIFVVAAIGNSDEQVTQYFIAEGNEDLHGEGWSGTNPTRHDETNVTFTGVSASGSAGANLTVLLLAGGKGQPDYVTFNGNTLGLPVRVENGINVTDIGDETSFDAFGESGTPSRYVDAETFPVQDFLKESDTVQFLRGSDLDGDGSITTTGDKPEGEDYIHPVSAVLSVTRPSGLAGVDLALENLQVKNVYAGKTGTISAEVRNYGTMPKSPVTVEFQADGKTLNTTTVTLPDSGIATISVPWQASGGTFTVSGIVTASGDTRPGNNEISRTVTVGTPPDLALTVENPVRSGTETGANATAKSPLVPGLAVGAIAIAGIFLAKKRGLDACCSIFLGIFVVTAAFSGLAVPVSAADTTGIQEYSLPFVIVNNGGSDSGSFAVTVYLDGEKTAEKTFDGVAAHGSLRAEIPLFVSPGTHKLRVVVDETGSVQDTTKENNVVQGNYVFP